MWWQLGAKRPVGIDLPHLSTVLKELDWVTGIIGGKGEGGTAKDDGTVTPIGTNQTMIVDWATTALLSGATVRCVDKHVRSIASSCGTACPKTLSPVSHAAEGNGARRLPLHATLHVDN